MSNFKKLLIPAIVLVVLVGAYLIVTNLPQNENEPTTTQTETIQIFDFKKDELTEVKIENKQETLHFRYTTIQVEEETTKEDGTVEKKTVDRNVWQAVQPEGMRVNSSSIDTIAWNANTLKAQKLIEENPSDLSVYGLDKPVRLTFVLKDGTRHVLLIGNETPTGGAYYAKKENDAPVYTIGDYEGDKFVQTKFDLLVKDLYDKEYTTEDFTVLKFSRKGNKVFDAELNALNDDKKTWWLSYPIDAEANYEHVYYITEALAGTTVNKYVDENVSDLGKYGLATPAYVFEYTMGGKDYKLSIGGKDESGALYAMMNDENIVFTISASSYTFLDKPIEELVSSFVHLQNINEVSELRVTFDGITDYSKINVDTEDDEKSTYEFNGTLLTGEKDDDYISAFKKYYQGAIGLTVDKIVLDVNPELKDPEVIIEHTLKTGEKILVELVPTPDGVNFYAFKNGKYTGMTLRKKQLENENMNGLRISRQKLVDALKERVP